MEFLRALKERFEYLVKYDDMFCGALLLFAGAQVIGVLLFVYILLQGRFH